MPSSIRGGGFRRLGARLPEGWPPSRTLAARLALEVAWREAVGSPLAERARCVGVRRGVLEIETSDRAWADAVRRLLPRIAARLAVRDATRDVRRFRLRIGQASVAAEPLPEAGTGADGDSTPSTRSDDDMPRQPDGPRDLEGRLRAIGRRLESRSPGERRPSPR